MNALILRLATFLVLIFGAFFALFASEMKFNNKSYYSARQTVRAPELSGGKSWLNTDKPLSLAALRGKIVLLDFWTYGCINCIHIIPDLKKLEAKYGSNLVVIGVHSAKFDNEGDTENIRQIILRYGIEHPVINDSDFKIWDQYAVQAYPTQVLIDPDGYVTGKFVGEGYFNEIDKAIGATVSEFSLKGKLSDAPLKFALERAKFGNLPLAFPGKILADDKSNRLFIADTNHNRIVITDLNGKLIDTIGSGEEALKDGNFNAAAFNKPHGLVLKNDLLYVADTDNHSIRLVKLKTKQVETIAGTGSLENFKNAGGDALKTSLRSPWDLELVGKFLYVAMAGSHQIWRLDLETNFIEPYAGTTREARTDGKIKESAFAQPSGIVSDGKKLFVADSESNIIRAIDFQKETVETLAGGDLYVFGDADGEGDDVLLQHPLGIEIYGSKILLADTYNHKIKLLNPKNGTVTTFLGTGKPGQTNGAKPTFYEPGGISVAGNKLFVADTNNHAVRVVDLKTKQTSTLKIENLAPPKSAEKEMPDVSPNLSEAKLEMQEIAAGAENSFVFNVKLPAGFHLNPNAPQRYEITVENGDVKINNPKQKFAKLPLTIPFQMTDAGAANLRAKLTVYYCREDNTGVCLIKTLVWRVPLKSTADKKTAEKINLSASVE